MNGNRRNAGLVTLSAVALSCVSGMARAQEKQPAPSEPPSLRTWVYGEDASPAAVHHAITSSTVTVTNAGMSGSRPFASNLGREGTVFATGIETGLTPWLSVQAIGFTDGPTVDTMTASGMMAGLRFAPISSGALRLSVSGGVLRELAGSSGAWTRLSVAQEVGSVRLAATIHAERVNAAGRDPLDVMVVAGVSRAIRGPLRVGIEYVGQDLEGAFDPTEAEGLRHFIGPMLALDFPEQHLSCVFGPAVGLSYGSPRAVGRMGISYSF